MLYCVSLNGLHYLQLAAYLQNDPKIQNKMFRMTYFIQKNTFLKLTTFNRAKTCLKQTKQYFGKPAVQRLKLT